MPTYMCIYVLLYRHEYVFLGREYCSTYILNVYIYIYACGKHINLGLMPCLQASSRLLLLLLRVRLLLLSLLLLGGW